MSEWGVTLEPGLQGLSDEARFGPDAREKGTVFLVEETRRAEAWWWGWGTLVSGGGVLLHFLSPFPSRPHAECSLHSLSPSCNFFLQPHQIHDHLGAVK